MPAFATLNEFLRAIDEPLDPPKTSIWQRWWAFHKRHPEVYDYLEEKTDALAGRGRAKYSMKALYNVARWHFEMERDEREQFKLDDRYHSRYARLLMAQRLCYAGMFDLRELRTA